MFGSRNFLCPSGWWRVSRFISGFKGEQNILRKHHGGETIQSGTRHVFVYSPFFFFSLFFCCLPHYHFCSGVSRNSFHPNKNSSLRKTKEKVIVLSSPTRTRTKWFQPQFRQSTRQKRLRSVALLVIERWSERSLVSARRRIAPLFSVPSLSESWEAVWEEKQIPCSAGHRKHAGGSGKKATNSQRQAGRETRRSLRWTINDPLPLFFPPSFFCKYDQNSF